MPLSLRIASIAALLLAGGAARAQAPSAEDRLRALEEQNQRLAAELEEVRTRLGPPADPTAPLEEEAKVRVDLKHGLQFSSPKERLKIQIHDLTQVEGRFFSPGGEALNNTFDIPRQRFYFAGQLDETLEFYTVLNRGYGVFDVLDAYVNFKFDPAFNVRIGRTKTPFNYEYYKIAEGDLIAPERSVFVGNLSTNRQIGLLAYGKVLDERLEYAAGVFNGPRRSFQDFNDAKTPFLFLNAKPFLLGNSELLRHLGFAVAGNSGRSDDPLEPTALRTANDETTTAAIDAISPAFLRFNPAARQAGRASFWNADVAWFYRQFTFLGQYNGGSIGYALGRDEFQVPYSGWSVAATWFLTGEEITSRKEIEPLRPFKLRDPAGHPGAVEAYFRAASLNAGTNVFTSGLADPALWSNDALVFDTGVNWYPNRYLRFFLDWQHSQFGSPVRTGPSRTASAIDLFWFRTQVFY